MVYSSLYLDPHNNWHQHVNRQQQCSGIINENSQHLRPLRPPSLPLPTDSIRPGLVADRARLAKIAQPETPLKCPRCDSTNTKFCYFNNYSLSQPRHFCKTCRRYWTRGGALRNVPVGGGCRRNKRNKNSKSPQKSTTTSAGCSRNSELPAFSSRGTNNNDMLNHVLAAQYSSEYPLMNLFGCYSSSDIGLNVGGFQTAETSDDGGIHIRMNSCLSSGISEGWRLQQFPNFLGNSEISVGVPSGLQGIVQQEQSACYDHQLRASLKQLDNINGITQFSPVKMEGNHGLNLSKNFLETSEDPYWGGGGGGNAWTDLSGFSSSSTSHLL